MPSQTTYLEMSEDSGSAHKFYGVTVDGTELRGRGAHAAGGGGMMAGGADWNELRDRRMVEPGAAEAYDAARLAFELGRAVRELREQHGWSQSRLAAAAGMTQSAVARFEAGGTVPTLPILERLAGALNVELAVRFVAKGEAA